MDDLVLTSSPDPNGVTFILNILLELGVKIEISRDYSLWTKGERGYKFNIDYHKDLPRVLPSLKVEKEYLFLDNRTVFWTHDFVFQNEKLSKNVFLFVRDPRDSLFSSRRRKFPLLEYQTYLKTTDLTVCLSRLDSWKLFHRSWLDFGIEDVFRFEELKLDPVPQVYKILSYLGVTRSSQEVSSAVALSSFERAKSTELEFEREQHKTVNRLNFGGKPFEWVSDRERRRVSDLVTQRLKDELGIFGYSHDGHLLRMGFIKGTPQPNLASPNHFFLNYLSLYRNRRSLSLRLAGALQSLAGETESKVHVLARYLYREKVIAEIIGLRLNLILVNLYAVPIKVLLRLQNFSMRLRQSP